MADRDTKMFHGRDEPETVEEDLGRRDRDLFACGASSQDGGRVRAGELTV